MIKVGLQNSITENSAQKEILVNIFDLVLSSGVCPETKRSDWARIILQAHAKGYLYMGLDNGILDVVVCAYRTPNIWDTDVMPEFESGNSLYVAWAASRSNDNTKLLRMLRQYLSDNPDIDRVYYYKRNSDTDFKEWELKHE